MITKESWKKLEKRFLPSKMIDAQNKLIDEIDSGRWDYVVFIVRRSFLFGLLAAKSRGIDLNDKSCCLTDSSFFVYLSKIAKFYKENRSFPSILFADDIIFKGRNLNSLLVRSEEYVCDKIRELLKESFDESEVRAAFKRAIGIHVCARVQGKNLLLSRYEDRLYTYTELSVQEWHKISSDQMLMLAMADIANASYTFSIGISEEKFEYISKKLNLISTLYSGNKEYTYVDVQADDFGNIKFIITLRFIRVIEKSKYRMIAFVITPELQKDTREKVVNEIRNRIYNREKYDGLGDFLCDRENPNFKRSQDEWISFFFSSAVLSDVCREFVLNKERYNEDEFKKLEINFSRPHANVEDNIKAAISDPVFCDIQDLKDFLWRLITSEEIITKCNSIQKNSNEYEIKDKLEHLYYVREINELRMISELSLNNPIVSGEINGKTQFPVWLPIDYVCDGKSIEDVKITVAFFLQMMDVGIHGVYAEDKRARSRETYNAYTKAAEQSLIIYPLKLYKRMAIIITIYEYCLVHHIDFNDHLDEYAQSQFCDINEDIDDIKEFVSILGSIGETPYDWKDSYFYRMEGFDPDDNEKNIALMKTKILQDQKSIELYNKFINNN